MLQQIYIFRPQADTEDAGLHGNKGVSGLGSCPVLRIPPEEEVTVVSVLEFLI